jgi:hypothetical protein
MIRIYDMMSGKVTPDSAEIATAGDANPPHQPMELPQLQPSAAVTPRRRLPPDLAALDIEQFVRSMSRR